MRSAPAGKPTKSGSVATPNAYYGRAATGCQMCKGKLELVIDLGHQPHADSFPKKEELRAIEVTYPLRLVSCERCGLLQIDFFVNPVILYQEDYLYVSSITAMGTKQYTDLSADMCGRFTIPSGSLIIDIGSNVGVLLRGFKDRGMRVLGVDPARITKQAIQSGIETVVDFFSAKVASQIKKKYGQAAVVTATNVIAHVHDLDDVITGAKYLLKKDGVMMIEAPHALPLVQNIEYDTIYHQHICYLSVRPMQLYFKKMGLELFSVKKLPIHGGSLRYLIGFPGKHAVESSVRECIAEEDAYGLYDVERLEEFAARVREQRRKLTELLIGLKKKGKRIIALSAPAKGNTLLNYCSIDDRFLDYATEKNPLKVGRFTPGTHVPIYPDKRVLGDMPDYALILAWNFKNEIMKNMDAYKKAGGKFIIPIPVPKII